MDAVGRAQLEIRLFLWFARWGWPVVRLFWRRRLSARCARCALSARAAPLTDGLCAACRESPSAGSTASSAADAVRLDEILRSAAGAGAGGYDALVLFSGGKDSAYLLWRLRRDHPRLRLLAFTFDNTFMSPVALENVARALPRLDVAHMTLRPPEPFMNKMFAHAFRHLNEGGCSGTVDQFDGDLLHDAALTTAARLGIPLVMTGLSRTQVRRILGVEDVEMPRDRLRMRRETVAGISLRDVFRDDERGLWWDGTAWPEERIPRYLFPFYAWDLSEGEIRRAAADAGLVGRGADNPLLTNNRLVPLMGLADMAWLGYSSFEPEFAQMVREGKADPRFWRSIFELLEYSYSTGRLISRSVDDALDRLGLTREDLRLPSRT